MRSYGQYCPIARSAEILAERWSLIVIRNLVMGCRTFTEIADGAPTMSRSLLSKRLQELESAGVVASAPNPDGRGSTWELTPMGQDLMPVLEAMGTWGARWLEMQPEHTDPQVVLWSWCQYYVNHDTVPEERTVVRFDFPDQPASRRHCWILAEHHDVEVCSRPPGPDEHLVVETDAATLAGWHLGRTDWARAQRAGVMTIRGPRALARQVPTWNRRSMFADVDPVV